jgi:hypothetical protein
MGTIKTLYTTADIARILGCSTRWIQALAAELIEAGHAQKVGRALVFDLSAADYIRQRPDGRGRPAKTRPD